MVLSIVRNFKKLAGGENKFDLEGISSMGIPYHVFVSSRTGQAIFSCATDKKGVVGVTLFLLYFRLLILLPRRYDAVLCEEAINKASNIVNVNLAVGCRLWWIVGACEVAP
jgi:hypothetical protein